MSNHLAPVRIFHIEKMTIDLFQFWLNQDLHRDLPSIAEGYHLTAMIPTHPKETEQYIRSLVIIWTADKRKGATAILWAQIATDTVQVEIPDYVQVKIPDTGQVEIPNVNNLSVHLVDWLKSRFLSIKEDKNAISSGDIRDVELSLIHI